MISRSSRALVGLVLSGLLALPLVVAAAPKKKPGKPAKPAAPAKAAGDAKKGAVAFKAEGCTGCHKSKEVPDGGPMKDLSKVGGEKNAAQLTAFIKNPVGASAMPAFKGSPATLADIVAYLLTQK